MNSAVFRCVWIRCLEVQLNIPHHAIAGLPWPSQPHIFLTFLPRVLQVLSADLDDEHLDTLRGIAPRDHRHARIVDPEKLTCAILYPYP
jgi:hypothetical protein